MKNKKKPINKRNILKPLVWFTLLGMSAGAQAIDSPFAFIPLHLQTTSESKSTEGVKPNILIQFDDSGSMLFSPKVDAFPDQQYWRDPRTGQVTPYAEGINAALINNDLKSRGWELLPAPGGKNRLDIARDSIAALIDNTTENYTEKANFGVISLWDHGGEKKTYAEAVVAGAREFPMSKSELRRIVRNLGASGGTPAMERYMDAAKVLDKAIKFRCQRSYIILFSDGDANGLAHQPTISNKTFTWTTNGLVSAGTGTFSQYTTWVAHKNPITYTFPQDMAPYVKQPPQTTASRFDAMFTFNPSNNSYRWNLTTPSRLYASRIEGWAAHPDAMPFVAHMLLNDLKTNEKDKVDAAGKPWDDELEIGNKQPNKIQNIKTYAIGFGEGLSTVGRHSLNNMSTANDLQALNASSQEELDAAFKKIFDEINEENVVAPPTSTSSISPAAMLDSSSTSHVLTGTASVYLDLASGSSEIRFFKFKHNRGSNYTVDSSGAYGRPKFGTRKVLFNRGGTDNRVFWLDDSFAGSNEMFDIPNQANNANANEWREALIPWLLRSKDDAEIASQNDKYAVKYRVRSTTDGVDKRNIGDILGTSLSVFGKPQHKRPRFLSTAANDGMFYLFESQDDENQPYALKMNYMPAGMQRESATDTVMKYYKNIAEQNYITSPKNPHLFLLNGDIETRATSKDIPERIFMSANMGQAGRGSFSINLAGQSVAGTKVGIDGSNWLSSVPLFETPKTAGNEMGYTIGRPGLGRLSVNRSVTFEGNGTNAKATMTTDLDNLYYATFVNSGIRNPVARDNTESALYVYSTLGNENVGLPNGAKRAAIGHTTGQLLKKLVASPNGGGLAQASLLDVDLDGVADLAYAGDYKGNLYRFDFRDGNPNNWTVNRMFTTKDNRPITSAPAIAYVNENTYVVVFGTGSDIYQSDLRNTDRQTVYGIYDYIGNARPVVTSGVSELLQQTFGLGQGVNSYLTRELSTNKMDPNRHKGWYFDLVDKGERVTVRPVTLLKTILLTTRIYEVETKTSNTGTNRDVCEPSSTVENTTATGWVMQFRSDTGGKLPGKGEADSDKFPFVDLTSDFVSQADSDEKKIFSERPDKGLISGVKNENGGLLALTLLAGHDDPHSAGGIGSSLNLNGELLGYQEPPPNPGGVKENDRFCFNSATPSAPLLVSDHNNKATGGVDATKDVYYAVCSGTSLRRISWREIF